MGLVDAGGVAQALVTGGHRELVGSQHVVRAFDPRRVAIALAARADAELVGSQDVVRLVAGAFAAFVHPSHAGRSWAGGGGAVLHRYLVAHAPPRSPCDAA